jgi:hypothetical protein
MSDREFSDIQIFQHSGKAIPLFMAGHKNCLQADYLLGPSGPSSCKKKIYRAAVWQRLRHTALDIILTHQLPIWQRATLFAMKAAGAWSWPFTPSVTDIKHECGHVHSPTSLDALHRERHCSDASFQLSQPSLICSDTQDCKYMQSAGISVWGSR